MKSYPRQGAGIEAFVDASDTGYTLNGEKPEMNGGHTNGLSKINVLNDDASATNGINGAHSNGAPATNGTNGVKVLEKHDSPIEKVEGPEASLSNGHANGVKA